MLNPEPPAWRVDAKWIGGVLATVAMLILVPLVTLVQLSSPSQAIEFGERLIDATLPAAGDLAQSEVRLNLDYRPGEDLELLPGAGATVPAEELGTADIDEVIEEAAAGLASNVVERGAPSVLDEVTDEQLAERLEQALTTTGRELVRTNLLLDLLPAGLDNGSRLANWQLQAQQNPGAEVQPVVGIFVTIPPQELMGLDPRAIGVRVVEILADRLFEQGLDDTLELVSNVNLRARLEESARGDIAADLADLLAVTLSARRDVLASRLEQARAIVASDGQGETGALPGVLSESEAAGLSAEERRSLVVTRLAQRGYRQGSPAVLEAVEEGRIRERLAVSAPFIDALDATAHARYRLWAWLAGAAAALGFLVLLGASRGWGRLANPGFALVIAASLGAFLGLRLDVWLPTLAATVGDSPVPLPATGSVGEATRFLVTLVYPEAVEWWSRNHLVALTVGVFLLLLALLLRIVRFVRPRRRSLL